MSAAELEYKKESRTCYFLVWTRDIPGVICGATSRGLSRVHCLHQSLTSSPALYQSIIKHHAALKSLQREHKKHLEREQTLSEILDTLRTSYNPNYQDMAVLDAVRGWEYLAGLPHINDVGKDASDDKEAEGGEEVSSEEEAIPEGEWTVAELEKDLPKLLKTDYVSLLVEHDEHVRAPAEGSLRMYLAFRLSFLLIKSSSLRNIKLHS